MEEALRNLPCLCHACSHPELGAAWDTQWWVLSRQQGEGPSWPAAVIALCTEEDVLFVSFHEKGCSWRRLLVEGR